MFRRIALNKHAPDQGTNSLFYAPLLVTGINGTSSGTNGTSHVPFSKENFGGYQFAAISGRDYRLSWDLPYRVDPSAFQLHPESARAADWVFLHSKQVRKDLVRKTSQISLYCSCRSLCGRLALRTVSCADG